eukprot:TRINITY_DN23257_c0_g1_i1.p1 TRINITY_DN23257_c0_g1~~TRINITY_DN23257_c0_g1_i1.p1  ORF type:complete len:1087 (+),score=134.22 TRINITY_DN23257_c0_g1_i1:592-3852(+)
MAPPAENQAPSIYPRLFQLLAIFGGALLSLALGIFGAVLKWHVPGLPNVFFGLDVLGTVLFLLGVPISLEALSEWRPSRTNSANNLEQPGAAVISMTTPPWARDASSVCKELGSDVVAGLSEAVAAERRARHGENSWESVKLGIPFLAFIVKEIYEPTQLLLVGVGVLYALVGEVEEACAAFGVIALMITAESWTEFRAKTALKVLEGSTPYDALVVREGAVRRISRKDVVIGDIVMLDPGMEVPADIRLLSSSALLEINESKMTGESLAVPKHPSRVYPDQPEPINCSNVALAGTLVSRGRGTGVVFAIGFDTAVGKTLSLVRRAKPRKTRLQTYLKSLAGELAVVAIVASILGALIGFWVQQTWQEIVLSGLSLMFVTIPEELPMLMACVLAIGGLTLSRRSIFTKQLRAIENLGFVDVVMTDKTGTLTENKLTIKGVWTGEELIAQGGGSGKPGGKMGGTDAELSLLEAWLFMSNLVEVERTSKDLGQSDERVAVPEGEGVERLGKEVELDPFDKIFWEDVHGRGTSASKKESKRDTRNGVGSKSGSLRRESSSSEKMTRGATWVHLFLDDERAGRRKVLRENEFDPTKKWAAREVSVNFPGPKPKRMRYFKGAPEVLLKLCSGAAIGVTTVEFTGRLAGTRDKLMEKIDKLALEGVRMIGYAIQDVPPGQLISEGSTGQLDAKGATFLGVIAFHDPIRSDALESIRVCQLAGVRVVMVTGDHVNTAVAVGRNVGLLEGYNTGAVSCSGGLVQGMPGADLGEAVEATAIFARASPADKLTVLEALQELGHCVAVTGDGVNDGPALANADVGLAMGLGTDVARAAASVVILDDSFGSLVEALREGRRLLDNLGKAIAFYLGAKAGLVLLFVVGTLMGRFPLAPIQIIILELFMDIGASTSFVIEAPDDDVMLRPPRPNNGYFIDYAIFKSISGACCTMAATVLFTFSWANRVDPLTAQTCSFYAWVIGNAMLAFNMRSRATPLLRKGLFGNYIMLAWLALAFGLTGLMAWSEVARGALKLVALTWHQWAMVWGIGLCLPCWMEVWKWAGVWSSRRVASGDDNDDREPSSSTGNGATAPLLSSNV